MTPEHIDRLVDGELSDAERRALLSALEAEPGAWRACALAFLEAQQWRSALAEPEPAARMPGGADRPRRPLFTRIGSPLLAAAALALAFWIGRSTGIRLPGTPPSVAGDPPPVVDPPSTDEAAPGTVGPDEAPAYQMVGFVEIPGTGGDPNETIDLPVLAGPGLDEGWLRARPSFVPDEWRRSWEDLGYRVEHQRRLVSVQVDDEGRYLSIPVDEVVVSGNYANIY